MGCSRVEGGGLDTTSLVPLVRSAYAGDWIADAETDVEDRLLDLFDPGVVFVPEPGTGPAVSGIGGVHRLLRAARDEWESCRYVLDDVERVNGTRALVSGRVVADLRESSARVSFSFVHGWRAQGPRVDRVEAYHDRDQALRRFGRDLAV